ncbi:MAG: hypothetical protein ACREAF_00925 [Nitrosopumilaceae archaeon]
MKKSNLQKIAALTIFATILLIPAIKPTQTLAQEEPQLDTDSVNEVGLKVIFHFREADEIVNSFKVIDTVSSGLSSGFDRTKQPTFRLEGVIGWDKPLLYKAIDTTSVVGDDVRTNDWNEFEVDVKFQRGEQTYRQFSYIDCRVKNYNVFTEYDKEESYNQKTDFAYIDRIDFECRGFSLVNPTYDKIMKDRVDETTQELLKNMNKDSKLDNAKSKEIAKAEAKFSYR